MTSLEAIRALAGRLGDALVVACNGYESRELFLAADRPGNFYMIGSMGLAPSLALGLALSRPSRRVVALDGDGNALMGMGAFANVGASAPANLTHLLFDNAAYASTGGQRTVSRGVRFEEVALACGYRFAARALDSLGPLDEALRAAGPALLVIEVESGTAEGLPRVGLDPPEIVRRFRAAVLSGNGRPG